MHQAGSCWAGCQVGQLLLKLLQKFGACLGTGMFWKAVMSASSAAFDRR